MVLTEEGKEALRLLLPDLCGKSKAAEVLEFAIIDAKTHLTVTETVLKTIREFIDGYTPDVGIPERLEFSSEPVIPKKLYDIFSFTDHEYFKFFHLSRNVTKDLVKRIESVALREEREAGDKYPLLVMAIPLELIVMVSLWYLSNADGHLKEAANIFEIDKRMIYIVILRGMKLFTYLQEEAEMCWPSNEHYTKIATVFFDCYHMPNIVGVITHRVFTATNGRRLLLQIFNDNKGMIRYANVHPDTRPFMAMGTVNEYLRGMCEIPADYRVVCDDAYTKIPKPLLKNNTLFKPNDKSLMNGGIQQYAHKKMLDYGEFTLKAVLDRFPRLERLLSSNENTIIAACVIHNICHLNLDLPPIK